MRYILLLLVLVLSTVTIAQTEVYKSKLTEYRFKSDDKNYPYEWINREIRVSNDKIFIKSAGKDVTEIQTWIVRSKFSFRDSIGIYTIYNTEQQFSDYKNEMPSTFIFFQKSKGITEFVDWNIPKPREDEFLITRFYIN